MNDAVLLLSSGLDSAANLALAGGAGFRVRVGLTVDYGQRGATREREHAKQLCDWFGVEHVPFELKGFSILSGGASALLGGQDVPTPESKNALDDKAKSSKTAAAVWVPNRNGVLIALAAALAESRRFGAVAVGFNAEEAVTFPDNSPEFMMKSTAALGLSTANGVEIVSATSQMNKTQIVAALARAGSFPFELLWSCYHAETHHCGRCESCQRLDRAISAALSGQERVRVMQVLFGDAR